MNICPFCGVSLSGAGRFCTSCGKALNLGLPPNEENGGMMADSSSKRPITDECVIEASKSKMFGLLLLCIGFLALSIFMLTKQKSVCPAYIVAILGLLVFGTFAVCLISVLCTKRAGLILNSRGFEFMATGIKFGFVPWEEVEGYRVQEAYNQKMLMILLKNPEGFVQRLHGMAKVSGNASLKLGDSPIALVSSGLSIDFQGLVNVFARYCRLYVTSAHS